MHNVVNMALHWRIKGHSDTLYIVLWLITVIFRVESAQLNSISIRPAIHTYSVNNIAYHRIRRTANGKLLQPKTSDEDTTLENTNEGLDVSQPTNQNRNAESIISKESDKNYNFKTEPKLKQNNKQQKTVSNEFKNYSNKVISETRFSTVNLNERQKEELYGHQGYILKHVTPNNKDFKPISGYILKVNTSNTTIQQKYTLDKKIHKLDLESEYVPSNVTKTLLDGEGVNETHMANDQPVSSDSLHNSTDVLEDESPNELSQNTTNLWDDCINSTNADGRTMPSTGGLGILITSGIIFGTVIFLVLIAGGGFAFYRHRIWNKPQTLSDKCSNADSSGYIDDSTLRENSEEMYSLDNDSFLNSLEAMTIQNYWTDNVKHTKL